MKIKTSELSGVSLDWAVAQVVGVEVAMRYGRELAMVHDRGGIKLIESIRSVYSPSTNWSQGGPLIERFKLCLMQTYSYDGFAAVKEWHCGDAISWHPRGETMLIAACRAIVAAKLGDEVDVPEGLV